MSERELRLRRLGLSQRLRECVCVCTTVEKTVADLPTFPSILGFSTVPLANVLCCTLPFVMQLDVPYVQLN